jgi:hypothetical protein
MLTLNLQSSVKERILSNTGRPSNRNSRIFKRFAGNATFHNYHCTSEIGITKLGGEDS